MSKKVKISKVDGLPLESSIQADILATLAHPALRITVWTMFTGTARGGQVYCTKGIPDLYCLRKGQQPVWLEVKRPGTGKLSPAQVERHAELRASGQLIFVVTSVDEALTALGIL